MVRLYLFTITLVFISACSTSQDSSGNALQKGAAGFGRALLAVGTLGISEFAISQRNTQYEAQLEHERLKCIEFGGIEDTEEYKACRIKLEAARLSRPPAPVIHNTVKQESPSHTPKNLTCYHNGNTTTCN